MDSGPGVVIDGIALVLAVVGFCLCFNLKDGPVEMVVDTIYESVRKREWPELNKRNAGLGMWFIVALLTMIPEDADWHELMEVFGIGGAGAGGLLAQQKATKVLGNTLLVAGLATQIVRVFW